METSEQIDLIDFSSENDNLIFTLSSPPPDNFHQLTENHKASLKSDALGDMEAGKENVYLDNGQNDTISELAESEELQGIRRKGKCNLRKSLAWDSAFFTCAGVLDPEELSSIMKGAGKAEKLILPGIPEDLRVSSDSISTLEGDNIESVEVELFGDIRASIQKSCQAVKVPGNNTPFVEASNKSASSPLADPDPAKQRSKPTRKMAGLQTIGIPKCKSQMGSRMQGSGRAMKPESTCSQAPKFAPRNRESTSSLPRPAKDTSRVCSTMPPTTKRASLSSNHAKSRESSKTGAQPVKPPISSAARRELPKSASCSKSSSLMVTKNQSSKSSKSEDSDSMSSGGKSPAPTAERKVAARALNPTSSKSTAKTPFRNASKSKSTSKNSTLSAYVMSSKTSPNISPASSISEWSSASSSTSSINQRSNNSRTSVGSRSSRCLEIDTPSQDMKSSSDDKMPNVQHNPGVVVPDENMKKSSLQTGTVSHSASMRPSGLRMPSPKIGFFDGVKSARTPNGTLQSNSGISMVLSTTEAGIPSKVRKLPARRVSTISANVNPESTPSLQEQREAATNLNVPVEESKLKSEEILREANSTAILHLSQQ